MSVPRYSSQPFPPYTYVPGTGRPHPVSDPGGHMHEQLLPELEPLTDSTWLTNETYLYGVDLFNHGYSWEAHEVWESLWHAAGRKGLVADFLKGLIKLAAAEVKRSEGNASGVQRHANRASELFATVDTPAFCGLSLDTLHKLAQSLPERAQHSHADAISEPRLRLLWPEP